MSIPKNLCGSCFAKLENSEDPCPFCGYDRKENEEKYPIALRGGSVLAGQYIVGHVLGQGGFGITYLAFDHLLGIKVAIKEFMPEGMVTRLPGTTQISVYTGDRQNNFNYGVERFLEEARVLAKFIGNPNIAGVKNFFNENNTSYFVMDYIEGISFKNYIKNCGGKIGYEDALRILVPVLRALADVHRENFIHRDVTPDNIYITKNGEIKLLDFGSARYSMGDKSKSLDIILKAGYAPKEQYLRHGKQGPWTDVYSVAACFYFSIAGNLPPESLERLEKDDLKNISALGIKLPAYLDDAIMKGLKVNASDRFQSANEFLQAIEEGQKYEEDGKPVDPAPNPDSPSPVSPHMIASHPSPILPQAVPTPNPPASPTAKRLMTNKILRAVGCIAAAVVLAVVFYQIGSRQNQYQDTYANLDTNIDVNDENTPTETIENDNVSNSGSGLNENSTTDSIDANGETSETSETGSGERNPVIPANLSLGQRNVPFGKYTWWVMDIQDGRALLLSEEIVEQRAYHDTYGPITWEDSDIRTYLNGLFLQSFTQEEQDAIVEVSNQNGYNQWYDRPVENATTDKIFLLSMEEAFDYFADIDAEDIQVRYDGRWAWWWLRSPGRFDGFAVVFGSDGNIHADGDYVHRLECGVRPALWIEISNSNSTN
jgi:serine/threonine protein kinase